MDEGGTGARRLSFDHTVDAAISVFNPKPSLFGVGPFRSSCKPDPAARKQAAFDMEQDDQHVESSDGMKRVVNEMDFFGSGGRSSSKEEAKADVKIESERQGLVQENDEPAAADVNVRGICHTKLIFFISLPVGYLLKAFLCLFLDWFESLDN